MTLVAFLLLPACTDPEVREPGTDPNVDSGEAGNFDPVKEQRRAKASSSSWSVSAPGTAPVGNRWRGTPIPRGRRKAPPFPPCSPWMHRSSRRRPARKRSRRRALLADVDPVAERPRRPVGAAPRSGARKGPYSSSIFKRSLAKRCTSPGQRADRYAPSRTVKPAERSAGVSRRSGRGPGS